MAVMTMPVSRLCLVLLLFSAVVLESTTPVRAQDCDIKDRACTLTKMQENAAQIEEKPWRDQTYREIAKSLAFDGNIDGALAVVDKIETPDTKALTIRGIGMAVADTKVSGEAYTAAFTKIRASADKITDPPSHAIALTYIAMAQAFAGDNEGAWKTASEMENKALRQPKASSLSTASPSKIRLTARFPRFSPIMKSCPKR
jgi:hypothetical protein